ANHRKVDLGRLTIRLLGFGCRLYEKASNLSELECRNQHVLVSGAYQGEPVAFTISGAVPDAGFYRICRMLEVRRASIEADCSMRQAQKPDSRLPMLAFAAAHQTGYTQDFTCRYAKTQVVDLTAFGGQAFNFEPDRTQVLLGSRIKIRNLPTTHQFDQARFVGRSRHRRDHLTIPKHGNDIAQEA